MNKSLMIALLASATLVACGGGGGDSGSAEMDVPAATAEVPAAASASTAGWSDYVKRLLATAPETLEPVDVSAVKGPTDDGAEPAPVN